MAYAVPGMVQITRLATRIRDRELQRVPVLLYTVPLIPGMFLCGRSRKKAPLPAVGLHRIQSRKEKSKL